MEPHQPSPRPAGRRTCSEEEWAWARADYLDGFAAPQIAAAYGMGVSTLRERAHREGWRRRDQPAAEAGLSVDVEDVTEEDQDVSTMVDTAWRRAALAIKTGDRLAARAWLRLHEDLLPILREIREIARADDARSSPVTADPDASDALDGLDAEPHAADQSDAPDGPTASHLSDASDASDASDVVSSAHPDSLPELGRAARTALPPGALDRTDRRVRAQVWRLRVAAANGAMPAAEAEAGVAALLAGAEAAAPGRPP